LGGVPVRLATPIAIAVLAAALLGGCGGSSSSSSTTGGSGGSPGASSSTAPAGASAHVCVLNAGGAEGLRATGVSCGKAQRLAIAWRRSGACAPAGGASRSACTVSSYRCLTTSTARGFTVACSRPGRSVAFTVRPR
jgi:hypothetical protein